MLLPAAVGYRSLLDSQPILHSEVQLMSGLPELIIIGVLIVLIFGVNKIPQLGKGIGEGIRNFKSSIKAVNEDEDETSEVKSKEEKQ